MIEAGEVELLEATLLPTRERHQLRLLAHGLRSLQAAAGRRSGELPDRTALEAWADAQPALAGEVGFRDVFLGQLAALGEGLREIARERGCAPLALDLQDLIAWSGQQADRRCSELSPPQPAPGPPG